MSDFQFNVCEYVNDYPDDFNKIPDFSNFIKDIDFIKDENINFFDNVNKIVRLSNYAGCPFDSNEDRLFLCVNTNSYDVDDDKKITMLNIFIKDDDFNAIPAKPYDSDDERYNIVVTCQYIIPLSLNLY